MIPLAASGLTVGATVSAEASAVAAARKDVSVMSAQALREISVEEVRASLISDRGLIHQIDTIRFSSIECVQARCKVGIREVPQIERNRLDGDMREVAYGTLLDNRYPEEDGYKIHPQVLLRNAEGAIVKDPVSQEARRLDFAVSKDGMIIRSDEVTSEIAPKMLQTAKEDRIREAGGNYIKDRDTGELIPFRADVRTKIVRMP